MKPQRSCEILKMFHDGSNRNLVRHDPITVDKSIALIEGIEETDSVESRYGMGWAFGEPACG